jgi:hypothetical protein
MEVHAQSRMGGGGMEGGRKEYLAVGVPKKKEKGQLSGALLPPGSRQTKEGAVGRTRSSSPPW